MWPLAPAAPLRPALRDDIVVRARLQTGCLAPAGLSAGGRELGGRTVGGRQAPPRPTESRWLAGARADGRLTEWRWVADGRRSAATRRAI